MAHPRWRKEVERLFAGRLSQARHQRLWQHLQGCDGCRDHYLGLQRFERALTAVGDASPLAVAGRRSHFDVERGWQRLQGATVPRARSSRGWVAALGLSLATLALVFGLRGLEAPSPSVEDAAYRAFRGNVPAAGVELSVLCGREQSVRFIKSGGSCAVGEMLALTAFVSDRRLRFARVVAWDAEDRAWRLAPGDAEVGSVPVRAGDPNQQLGAPFELTRGVATGELRVRAWFAESASALNHISDLKLRSGGVPGDGRWLEREFRLVISPAGGERPGDE